MGLFKLGQVVATPGALSALRAAGQSPVDCLNRHVNGDWGDVSDKQQNNDAVRNGQRILSIYQTSQNETIWIITEHDRSSTCILLPDDY
jgi:hypothetical protein